MSNAQVRSAYANVERASRATVEAAIDRYGVPTSPEQAAALAEQLLETVQEQRLAQWTIQARALEQSHPGLQLAPPREYKTEHLTRAILRASGLMPDKPMTVPVEMYDEATRALAVRRIAPYAAPDDEAVQRAIVSRLAGTIARHSKQAGRDAVIDTAGDNGLRWARQLTGAENCAFCAMLVSRGAVYREATAYFQTHDNCDCTATVVAPGVAKMSVQARALRNLWDEAATEAGGGTYKDTLREYRKVLDAKPGTLRRIGGLADYEQAA